MKIIKISEIDHLKNILEFSKRFVHNIDCIYQLRNILKEKENNIDIEKLINNKSEREEIKQKANNIVQSMFIPSDLKETITKEEAFFSFFNPLKNPDLDQQTKINFFKTNLKYLIKNLDFWFIEDDASWPKILWKSTNPNLSNILFEINDPNYFYEKFLSKIRITEDVNKEGTKWTYEKVASKIYKDFLIPPTKESILLEIKIWPTLDLPSYYKYILNSKFKNDPDIIRTIKRKYLAYQIQEFQKTKPKPNFNWDN